MVAAPVVDGFLLKRNVQKQPFAGKYLSNKVLELLDKQSITVTPQYLVQSKVAVDAGLPAKAKLRSKDNITPSFHDFAVSVSMFLKSL